MESLSTDIINCIDFLRLFPYLVQSFLSRVFVAGSTITEFPKGLKSGRPMVQGCCVRDSLN
jgi:hypothetical protein